MDWGELFGSMLGSVGMGLMASEWRKIKDPQMLRLRIRHDIREFLPETARMTLNSLRDANRLYGMKGDSEGYDHGILIIETFIEECEKRNLM